MQFAALSKVVVERAWNSVRVTLHSSRPGLVIGRKGSEIERMTNDISKICGGNQVKIDIVEVRKPELDAQLVAENVAVQLERRISFRRAMKRALQTAMDCEWYLNDTNWFEVVKVTFTCENVRKRIHAVHRDMRPGINDKSPFCLYAMLSPGAE